MHFADGKADLPNQGREAIFKVARGLLAYPGQITLAVTGFTSSTGNRKVNQQLSLKRAMAVAAVLEEAGIRRDTVQVQGRGADDPIADNATKDGREKNRRVEIQVHVLDPNVETRKHIVPQS